LFSFAVQGGVLKTGILVGPMIPNGYTRKIKLNFKIIKIKIVECLCTCADPNSSEGNCLGLYSTLNTPDVTHTLGQVRAKILCSNPTPICVVSSVSRQLPINDTKDPFEFCSKTNEEG